MYSAWTDSRTDGPTDDIKVLFEGSKIMTYKTCSQTVIKVGSVININATLGAIHLLRTVGWWVVVSYFVTKCEKGRVGVTFKGLLVGPLTYFFISKNTK